MTISYEKNLADFDFWGGATNTVEYLTSADFEELEAAMEDGKESWTETEINDFFWFEEDWIAQLLGYEDWEDLVNQREGEE